MADTMNFGPEWVRSLSSGSNQNSPPSPVKPTTPLGKRLHFKLAEFRYGKEELLQLCTEDSSLPSDLPFLATITRRELVTPLAFIPLSEEEQVAMSGGVNSGTVYGVRGGRGYYGRGRGRGRGRGDYHRSTSYPEDPQSGGYYGNKGSGEWSESGRGYSGGGRGNTSRASRDGNWRNPSNTAEDEEWGNNHWNPPPSPGKQPGGWKDKESDQKWQAIPEWANDDGVTAKSVGTFDSSGKFSTGSKDGPSKGVSTSSTADSKDKKDSKLHLQNPPNSRADMKKDSIRTSLSYSTVASKKDNYSPQTPSFSGNHELNKKEPDVADCSSEEEEVFEEPQNKNSKETVVTASPPRQSQENEGWVASPSSFEDERMKQIEKAAEALLSTEEDETPVSSPKVHDSASSQTPNTSTAPPSEAPTLNPEDMNKWLYQDPQGEIQGPFSSPDMKKWFDAGYFTMDLMVRRACDCLLLPLGHVIRVWGRPPFNASGPVPPPLRPEEVFWQNLFKQPQVVYQQQIMMQKVKKSQQQVPKDQTESVGVKIPQSASVPASTSSETSSIWARPKAKPETGEDQWPDITGSDGGLWDSHQSKEVKQQGIDEEKAKKEQQRLKEMRKQDEERALREKQKQQQLAEEKQRQLLQEQQRRLAEEHQRQVEERQRQIEAERQKQIEENKRKELLEAQRKAEEKRQQQIKAEIQRQRQKEEEARITKQLEETQRLEQAERDRRQHMLMRQQQQQAWLQQQQQFSTAPVGRQAGPSLLQIQQEEEAQAIERRREESMRVQYQAQQPKHQQHSGWSSTMTIGSQPRTARTSNKALGQTKSFLEIQQEQESAFQTQPVVSSVATAPHTVKEQHRSKSTWSNVTSKQPWPQTVVQQPHREKVPSMSTDNDDDCELSFWEECEIEAKNNPAPSTVQKKTSHKQTSTSKEEERIRRLLSSNDASAEFNSWCEAELRKFNTDVDAATFVSFLLEVDSVYEVHDYIKSYLGETIDAHDFAKQFLDKRQKVKPSQQSAGKKSKSRDRTLSNSGENSSTRGAGPTACEQDTGNVSSGRAKQKKKKRMQKVNAATLLGFTVNAADRPNMGEIQSVRDTM